MEVLNITSEATQAYKYRQIMFSLICGSQLLILNISIFMGVRAIDARKL